MTRSVNNYLLFSYNYHNDVTSVWMRWSPQLTTSKGCLSTWTFYLSVLGTGLQGQAVFKHKLTFRPHSTDSQTHRKMTLSIADRFSKAQKIRVLPAVGKDPESQRNERIKVGFIWDSWRGRGGVGEKWEVTE